MHTLLLADNVVKARFLQRGLQCENLFCDIGLLASAKEEIETMVAKTHGIFINTNEDTSRLEEYIDLCLKIKNHIPIILLSPLSQISSFEELYHEGKIRNFFIRPFPFRLIAAEMRSNIFHDREKIENGILKIRELELNRETHETIVQGQSVYLRNKEFALLEFLMLNEGRVLSRGTILENVWDHNANIFTNTVDVHINKLRRKIDIKGKFIRTIPCTGYVIS